MYKKNEVRSTVRLHGKCRINGQIVDFIADTGAEVIVLSEDAMKRTKSSVNRAKPTYTLKYASVIRCYKFERPQLIFNLVQVIVQNHSKSYQI
jgi:hypothetical protein